MNLDEAVKKYGISVPSDAEFYSEDYVDYFENKKVTKELSEKFSKYEDFQRMYVKSFYVTFYAPQRDLLKNKKSIADFEAVILGGQAGAGKSRTCG